MDKPGTSAAPLIVAIVLLLLPALYVGSYLVLVVPRGTPTTRSYRENGQTVVETYLGHYRAGGAISERLFWQ